MPATNPSGYRVIEKQDITVGLNITAVVGLVSGWMGLGFAGGISTTYGKGYLLNKWVPTLEDANKFRWKVEVPTTVQMIKENWKTGDTISTSRSKSLLTLV
jgi:hypothetical protein